MYDNVAKARAFRLRAEEVRSVAGDMKQQNTRDMLERTARDLDGLAEQLEELARAQAVEQGMRPK